MRIRSLFVLSLSPMLLSILAVALLVAAPLGNIPAQRDALVHALDERSAVHDYTVSLEKDILEALAGLSGDAAMVESEARLQAWASKIATLDEPDITAVYDLAAETHHDLSVAVTAADTEGIGLAFTPALDTASEALRDANERVDRRMARLAASAPPAAGLDAHLDDARTYLESSRAAAAYARGISQVAATLAIAGAGDDLRVSLAVFDAERLAEGLAATDAPGAWDAITLGERVTQATERLVQNGTLGQAGLAQLWEALQAALDAIDGIRDFERQALRNTLQDLETRAVYTGWITGAGAASLGLMAGAAVWAMQRRVLGPTLAIHAATEAWTGEGTMEGLPPERDDEIGTLSRSVAEMAARITETTRRLRGALDQSMQDREELQRSYDLLAQADRLRSHILNTASHELRTPLTPLRLQVRLLKSGAKGPLSPGQEKAVDAIESNLRRLVAVVDAMTQLHDLQEGQAAVHLADIDLSETATTAGRAHQAAMDAAGIGLEVTTPGPVMASADPARLRQVLAIVLDNARKFTPAGGHVQITVSQDRTIEVTDDGAGMAPEDVERLFRAFERGLGENDAREAAGLGLAIADAVMERMGGTIVGTSPGPGQGSTFRLTLQEPSL